LLEIRRLNTFYDRIQVIWDVSFDIREKEIVAMVGANGAGKSTILNVISGLHDPASGAIEFIGQNIEGMNPQQIISMGIAYIPEGRRLFPDMTVRENLELGAYMPMAWRKRKPMIEQVYHIFPALRSREKQMAKTLSGGEQQMLCIGRGIMTEPKLCMIDEASYGLAPLVSKNILGIMKSLRKDKNMTLLLIEQNVKAALEAADRAYVLENGRIVLEGSSGSVLQDENVKKAYLGL